MHILYIGGGFVGACSAAVSADSGHKTVVFDVDTNKIKKLSSGDHEQIDSCIFEEGLAELLIRNSDRITFSTDYSTVEKFLEECDAIFLCLPTPEIGETGESNLSFYYAAAEQLAGALAKRNGGKQEKYVVIINKSTVPIELINQTEKILEQRGVKNFGIVSNPEFLVEGKAIEGSIHPDRVVVGAWKQKDFEIMRELYQRFYTSTSVKYIETNPKEAAAGKLLANFYLFNKLAVCFDVIGRTTETFSDISFENVRKIMATDPRIGSWGFYDSLYAGGSCFIKDARSLSHQLHTAGQDASIVDATYLANRRQLELFLGRAEKEANFSWEGKKVALLGLAFKQDTNDIRNSPSIDIVNFLVERRVSSINLYDPVAADNFKSLFPASPSINYYSSEAESIAGTDAVIVSADWPQFRSIVDTVLTEQNHPLLMDGRRIWQHRYADLQKAGFSIIAVGSPFIKGKN